MSFIILICVLQHLLMSPLTGYCINNSTLITEINEISSGDIVYNKWQNTNASNSMLMGDGKKYTNFLTITPSESSDYGYIIWPLNSTFSSFTAVIGLSNSNKHHCLDKYGSEANYDGVIYKFYVDNMLTYTSSRLQYATSVENINIDTTNGVYLKIEIYKLNSAACDNAVIANPILKCASNMNIFSTVFVTETSVSTTNISSSNISSATKSSKSPDTTIIILICTVSFVLLILFVILTYRAKKNESAKTYIQNIRNTTPITDNKENKNENEMQPLGMNKDKSDKMQYIHATVASDTVVCHQEMDTMADIDIEAINSNDITNSTEHKNTEDNIINNEQDTKLVLDNYDTSKSEVIELNHAENQTLVIKHSIMETITDLDVGSLPKFEDEIDDDNEENDHLILTNYNTGNSDVVDMHHSTQITAVMHSSMNTLADIDTELLPQFDENHDALGGDKNINNNNI